MADGKRLNGSADLLAEAMRKIFREEMQPVKETVDGLKTDVDGLKEDVGNLKSDMSDMDERFTRLETDMQNGFAELRLAATAQETTR